MKVTELLLKGSESLCDMKSFSDNVLYQAKDILSVRVAPKMTELDKVFREEQEAYYLKQNDIDKMLDNLKMRQDEILKNAK